MIRLGDNDLQASPRLAARIASRMPKVKVHRYPLSHCDVYVGSLFEEISSAEVELLRRRLTCTAS